MDRISFAQMLQAQYGLGKSVCLGFDPVLENIPPSAIFGETPADTYYHFCATIVAKTKKLVLAYKPNVGFWERLGPEGMAALIRLIAHIHEAAPGVPVIADGKYGDIGPSNANYAAVAFNLYNGDAATVSPFLGSDSLEAFTSHEDRGVFVLCKTSNKSSVELQNQALLAGIPLYEHIALMVASEWDKYHNLGVVAGATFPGELKRIRQIVGTRNILAPGVGTQQGDLQNTVLNGVNVFNSGLLINVSSSALYASKGPDYAEASARYISELQAQITDILKAKKAK